MPTSTIWISYDLGVRGDYEGLYAWLDEHDAKECGDSLAVLKYEHAGDLLTAVKQDLEGAVGVNNKTRIYVIHREPETKLMKGRFVIGGRRASPWDGYARSGNQVDEDAG